jgi:hypothetical protein
VRIALALVFLVVALAAAGCGGGGGDSAEGAPPDEWAADVCGALSDWNTALEDGATQIQADAASATSIQEARQLIVDYLDQAIERTDEMLNRIEEAGTPAVDDGEAIAQSFRDELAKIKPIFEDARETAANLPDDPQAFAEQGQELGTSITSAGDEIGGRLQDLSADVNSEELDQAFNEEPTCERFQ